MSILSQFLIMHDTFSSHHANVFWREIQTCSHPNTLKMNHVNKQHFTSLFSYGISCWLSMQKGTLYLCCFLVAEFLIAYAWQFIICHVNGFGGKFKKKTSLHYGISCWYPCKKVTWPVYYVVFWWQYAHRLTLCWDFALHLRSSLSHHLDPA